MQVSDLFWCLVQVSPPIIAGVYLLFLAFTKSMDALTYIMGAIFIIFPIIVGFGLFFYENRKEH